MILTLDDVIENLARHTCSVSGVTYAGYSLNCDSSDPPAMTVHGICPDGSLTSGLVFLPDALVDALVESGDVRSWHCWLGDPLRPSNVVSLRADNPREAAERFLRSALLGTRLSLVRANKIIVQDDVGALHLYRATICAQLDEWGSDSDSSDGSSS